MVELPRPGLPGKSPKLKTPFPPAGKSPVQAPPALLAAKQRVKGLLGKLGGKGAAGSSSLLERYLETLLSDTAEGEALKQDLLTRARNAFDGQRAKAAQLTDFLRPLQSRELQLRLYSEILRPAYSRQITSRDCANRLGALLAIKAPFLDAIDSIFGPLTLTVGGGAEAGAGFGIEGAVGLAFSRGSPVGVVHAITIALGAYAEASASIQGAISGGRPEAGEGVTVDVSVSAASGISGEFLVSLTPVLHPPTLLPEKGKADKLADADNLDDVLDATTRKIFGANVYSGFVVDYKYAGYSLSLGVGAGLGGAAGLTGSTTFLLPGLPS